MNVSVQDLYNPSEVHVLDQASLDPGMYYRFVQERSEQIARYRMRGFRMVSLAEDGVRTIVEMEQRGDDTVRVGDTVLMCCPKSQHLVRQSAKQQIVKGRLEDTASRLKEKIAKAQASGLKIELTEKYEPDDGE
jgi:hypothetical protein